MKKEIEYIEAVEKVPLVWIKIPQILLKNYEKFPKEFKLIDVEKLCRKEESTSYHRNTYQNWINFLRKIEIVELSGKKYIKNYLRISEGAAIWLRKMCEKYEKE